MAFTKPLQLRSRQSYWVLAYGGSVVAKVSKSGLAAILADLKHDDGVRLNSAIGKADRRTPSKKKEAYDSSLVDKACQFARAYAKAKKKFYHTKTEARVISEHEPNFKHLISAVELAARHGVSYQTYIESQISGLGFVDGGRGIFPAPRQLITEGAETRLLEFLRKKSDSSDGGMTRITDIDRQTPLSDNSYYMTRKKLIEDGVASLQDALYVRQLQKIRRGKVESYVQDYIDDLRGGEGGGRS